MATVQTTPALRKRYDFVYMFDVTNGNPNGDPDAGNAARVDAETGHGIVTDVCLKRKIRDFVTLTKSDRSNGAVDDGYRIYIQHRGVLQRFHQEAYEVNGSKSEEKGKGKKGELVEKARNWMCANFFDIRAFGAVLTLEINCGQVRGPVQVGFARSVDPILQEDLTIVRKAVATEQEADNQMEKHGQVTGTMGNKNIVPYALYECHGFISPYLAADTGFNEEDLGVLWQSLQMMFEHDRSAARGEMSARKLVVFEHENMLGNAPAHALFDRIQTTRLEDAKPPRKFSDYNVSVNRENLPAGITIHEML